MDEEKQKPEETATPDKDEGVQQETNRTVDDINLASKRSEEAAERLREENDRMENNYAKMKAGGRSEAGQVAVKEKISDEEYAKKAMENILPEDE